MPGDACRGESASSACRCAAPMLRNRTAAREVCASCPCRWPPFVLGSVPLRAFLGSLHPKPRIARHSSPHILLRGTCRPLPLRRPRGGVSPALAALPGRNYVDRPAVLLQLRAGAIHGGSGPRRQKHRNPEAAAAGAALV